MLELDSSSIESLFLLLVNKGHKSALCIDAPVIAVFLDQKKFTYHLYSFEYEFDFLDHFSIFSGEIDTNKNFDCVIIFANRFLNYRLLLEETKRKLKNSTIYLICDKKDLNKFLPLNLNILSNEMAEINDNFRILINE